MSRPFLLVLLSATIGIPHFASGQGSFPTGAKRLDNTTLAFVLLWGEPVDLKRVAGGDKQPLTVRLWQTPIERSCGPAGHLICAYQYHLAVDDPGEGGEPTVYDLGEFGTIQSMKWLSKQSDESDILQLSVLNFPAHVFRYWPGLKRVERTFLLTIRTDSVVVRAKR